MQHIFAYIHFPENIVNKIDTLEEGEQLLNRFHNTIELIDCERDSVIYYSSSNKSAFIQHVKIGEDLLKSNFVGNYDFETTINVLLDSTDVIQINEAENKNCSFLVYNSVTKETDKNTPIIFQTISNHYKNLVAPQKQLFINFFNEYYVQNPISIIVDCEGNEDKMYSIPYVTDFFELDRWLLDNREKRKFNFEDTRHILGDPIYHQQRKSPLLDGIAGRAQAAKLLENAIGDKRRSDYINDLVNFDEQKGEYIWYKYEGDNPQNQYHGYHVVTHENHAIRDMKTYNIITKRVLKIINYRKI